MTRCVELTKQPLPLGQFRAIHRDPTAIAAAEQHPWTLGVPLSSGVPQAAMGWARLPLISPPLSKSSSCPAAPKSQHSPLNYSTAP